MNTSETTTSPNRTNKPAGIDANTQKLSSGHRPTEAPQPWRLTRAAVKVTGQAVAAPYLKIIGGAMVVIGFGTSFLGFGFILGCVGAGLLFASTGASCVIDANKDRGEREGQVNVLLKSAGWATVGSLLLIPYWIGSCMDRFGTQHDADKHQLLSPSTISGTAPVSPQNIESIVRSPKTPPNQNIWHDELYAASPKELDNRIQPIFPSAPTNNPTPTVTSGNVIEDSQSRISNSSSASVSESDQYTDMGPEEYLRPEITQAKADSSPPAKASRSVAGLGDMSTTYFSKIPSSSPFDPLDNPAR